MTIDSSEYIITKEDEYYILHGDIVITNNLTFDFDKPLFISGSLKVNGDIFSNCCITCSKSLECDDLDADGMIIKTNILKAKNVIAKALDTIDYCRVHSFRGEGYYSLGNSDILIGIQSEKISSKGRFTSMNTDCIDFKSNGFVKLLGMTNITNFSHNDIFYSFKETVCTHNKVETIFSNIKFISEMQKCGKIENSIKKH